MALTQYWQRGEAIDYVNAGTDPIAYGDVVVLGSRVGVAGCTILPGDVGSLHVTGVFLMPKASGSALDLGAEVYWDATNKVVTATDTGNTLIGWVIEAAASAATEVKVKLNG